MKSTGGTVYDSRGNDVGQAPKGSVWVAVSVEWKGNEDAAFLLKRGGFATWAHSDEITVI